jgi:hypothetical protein
MCVDDLKEAELIWNFVLLHISLMMMIVSALAIAIPELKRLGLIIRFP